MEEKNKTSRAASTREKTERPKQYKPPSSLDAPPAPDGFRHRWIRAESLYSSALTNSYPSLSLPKIFLLSWKPTDSALIHLCLKPSGAGGASRDEGGLYTFGLSVFDRVTAAREVFWSVILCSSREF